MFSIFGIEMAQINNKNPCEIAEIFVLPPNEILALLRTITCVTGKPPINPEIIFPKP